MSAWSAARSPATCCTASCRAPSTGEPKGRVGVTNTRVAGFRLHYGSVPGEIVLWPRVLQGVRDRSLGPELAPCRVGSRKFLRTQLRLERRDRCFVSFSLFSA